MYSLLPILGPDPDAPVSAEAYSLGNDGQAAGTTFVNDEGQSRPVGAQWLNGWLTSTLAPPNHTTLWGINDGLIAVGSMTTDNYATESAIIVDAGNVTDLSNLVAPISWAADVNDQGVVCGGGTNGEGFLYSVPANRLVATVPALNLAVINNQGEAVGFSDSGKPGVHSVASGTTKMLDAMESAYGINDAGVACGAAGTPPTYKAVPGTCDTRQATPVFQPIPLPAGATEGTATAINNSGDVVGSCVFDDPSLNNGFHFGAFLYQNGTTTLLDKLISDPGWHLEVVFDINASGQIIGMGKQNGTVTAFMLSPTTSWPWWHFPLPVLVGRLLGGVADDAGGSLVLGGRPIPIDPWGPWLQLQPEKRDALIALAIDEIASSIFDEATRVQVRTTLVEAATSRLKGMNVRRGRTGPRQTSKRNAEIPRKHGLPVSWLKKFGR
ncbi:hypothetical protein [Paraburkholderia sp. MM6662-R1]|uniref:hypothetical protein n=1 Tax=Paraburkholderia sp. MM6662-R1 TaxID=2991066 RepID=UPI003D21331F